MSIQLLMSKHAVTRLHGEHSKRFGEKRVLSDSEIREQMFILNPDREKLVEDLYKLRIF